MLTMKPGYISRARVPRPFVNAFVSTAAAAATAWLTGQLKRLSQRWSETASVSYNLKLCRLIFTSAVK